MKQIKLTQGQVALVDDADYDELSKYKWFAHKHHSGYFYAVRNSPTENGKRFSIRMSRQILGLERGDKRQGDHINRKTLDNRHCNLRICSYWQNTRNRKPNLNTTSQFKGVSWDKQRKKWKAYIYLNGKLKHLGYWDIEEVAALRYDMIAIREYGEFAFLNFN